MAMKPSTRAIIQYLQEHNSENLTAKDVAAALGLTDKTVNGAFTQAVQRKELGYRAEDTVTGDDGNPKIVKYLKLNDAGMALDLEADSAVGK